MTKTKKLVIVGDSAFAEVAFEYFTYDSDYEVSGFSVESAYLSHETKYDLPVVPFETLEQHFSPEDHEIFVAVTYQKLNRLRVRLYQEAKIKGYKLASYISSQAFVWKNATIGEHVFIFEDNTVQPFVSIGDNVVLWSGNHIGHHSTIKDHCFISSQVVISGFCEIGERCFIGVNSTVSNNVTIGDDNFIGMAAVITKDTEANSAYKSSISEKASVPATKLFKV